MFHLCGGYYRCPNAACSRIYCVCSLGYCYSCGYRTFRRSDLFINDRATFDKYTASLKHDSSAAPGAKESPHGEGPIGAVGAGDGVDIIEGRRY